MFKLFDSNNDGLIDFGEFIRTLSIFHPDASQAEKIAGMNFQLGVFLALDKAMKSDRCFYQCCSDSLKMSSGCVLNSPKIHREFDTGSAIFLEGPSNVNCCCIEPCGF